MKIIVGIPSLNEADSIAYVAERLDEGITHLQAHFSEAEVVLINVDSSSTDGTVDAFLSARVIKASREVIVVPEQAGKGKNLLALLHRANECDASAVVTIDADITSITAEWLSLLVSPILEEVADLSVPQYARSRYEGSTTNHFAFPLVSSVAGFPIRQPIGGDFAISMKLVQKILSSTLPCGGERYGIDIWFSLTAALTNSKIGSIYLGKKLHKPSFNKLVVMFPQIAGCALSCLKEHRWRPSAAELSWSGFETNITADTSFRHESAAREMFIAATNEVQQMIQRRPLWVSGDIAEKINKLLSTDSAPHPDLWASLLAKWTAFGLREESESMTTAKELLPFFTWRSVSFWFEARMMNEREIEEYLVHQSSIFNDLLRHELTG